MNKVFIVILIVIIVIFYLIHTKKEKFFLTTTTSTNPIFSYSIKSNDGTKVKINGEDIFWTFELDSKNNNSLYFLGLKNNNELNFLTMPELNKYVLTENIINKKKLNMLPHVIMYWGQNNYIFVNLNGVKYFLKTLSNGEIEWTTYINEASKYTFENN